MAWSVPDRDVIGTQKFELVLGSGMIWWLNAADLNDGVARQLLKGQSDNIGQNHDEARMLIEIALELIEQRRGESFVPSEDRYSGSAPAPDH